VEIDEDQAAREWDEFVVNSLDELPEAATVDDILDFLFLVCDIYSIPRNQELGDRITLRLNGPSEYDYIN